MKTFKFLCLSIAFLAVVSGCNKTPRASFAIGNDASKTLYTAGDKVVLTNTSENGVNYRWTLPYGATSIEKDITFEIDSFEPDGLLNFKLEAFNKNFTKKDEINQRIKVQAKPTPPIIIPEIKYGNVMFFRQGYPYPISVTVNYFTQKITSNETTPPHFGKEGSATFWDLKVGRYSYYAIDEPPPSSGIAQKSWTDTFSIHPQEMKALKLPKP